MIITRARDVRGNIDVTKIHESEQVKFVKRLEIKKVLAPRYARPHPDLELRLPPTRITFKNKQYYVGIHAKVRKEGTLTIEVNIPFKRFTVDGLIALALIEDGQIKVKGKEIKFVEWVDSIYTRMLKYIEKAIEITYQVEIGPEDYVCICVEKISPKMKIDRLLEKKAILTGILRGWTGWRWISKQEIEDATSAIFTYTQEDAVIVDWDCSLLINTADLTNDILSVIDLANIQRLELRLYAALISDSRRELTGAKIYGFFRSLLPPSMTPLPKLTDLRRNISELLIGLKYPSIFATDSFLGKVHTAATKKFQVGALETQVRNSLQDVGEDLATAAGVRSSYWLEVIFIVIVIIWIIMEFTL